MVIERQKSIAEQVEQRLREKISSAEYPPGGRLPSESELAAQFGVSRATVRTALTALEAARLIVRRQGDGTYINKQIMEVDTCLGEEWDFQYMIKASGRVCRITPVSVELRSAADEEAAALEIEPGEQVLAVLQACESPLLAIGLTASGQPRHPLYAPKAAQPLALTHPGDELPPRSRWR